MGSVRLPLDGFLSFYSGEERLNKYQPPDMSGSSKLKEFSPLPLKLEDRSLFGIPSQK